VPAVVEGACACACVCVCVCVYVYGETKIDACMKFNIRIDDVDDNNQAKTRAADREWAITNPWCLRLSDSRQEEECVRTEC
jgi:hypothetical protein